MGNLWLDLAVLQLLIERKQRMRKAPIIPQVPANDNNKPMPEWLKTFTVCSWTFVLVYAIVYVLAR